LRLLAPATRRPPLLHLLLSHLLLSHLLLSHLLQQTPLHLLLRLQRLTLCALPRNLM
jgi:hypothetical protein